MNIESRIDQIIQDALPTITSGNETLESVVAKDPKIADELRPRLEAAIWLRQARFALATRPGYIHDSRRYLETKIESLQPTGFWQRFSRRYTLQRWVFNIAAPVIVFLLLALVINSAVLTARLSIPGDPLYTTKLITEDLQLALTFDKAERTELYIQFSRERALEFVELVMEGEYDRLPTAAVRMESEIIASLRSLNDITTSDKAIEHSIITNFKNSLTNEISMLNVLKTTSPASAYSGIELAINVAKSGLFALR
jgi:hypothetical protein